MATDLSNWRTPGHQEYSFQNTTKLLNTHTIKAGSKAKPLAHHPQDLSAFNLSRKDQPPLNMEAWKDETATNGLVILHNDSTVHESYARTNDASSKHILFSITKSVTGLLAGILVAQGKLDVDASVTKYVPEVKGTPLGNASVRECLDMRSGVKLDDNTHEYRAAMGWEPLNGDEKVRSLREYLSSFNAESTGRVEGLEGWPFEYASVNTDLVGWVLERAAGDGRSFAQLVEDLLWKPMGAESDAWMAVDREGSARAAGGLCCVVRDLARVGQLVLHDGDGVVPTEWVQDLIHGGSREAWDAGPWALPFEASLEGLSYRAFWYYSRSEEILMGMGIHGQTLLVDRKRKVVMAKTSSQANGVDFRLVGLTIDGFKEICRVLDG